MILVCPFCGSQISQSLNDGISSCNHCNQIFDSCLFNRLLAASWLLKNNNYHGVEQLISDTKLPEHEAIFVYSFIVENLYSHDEFIKVLKMFGIANK